MNNQGIRSQVLIITLLPLLLITLSLGSYFTYTRLKDLDTLLIERGLSVTRQISALSAYGVDVENTSLLNDLVVAALDERDVRSVTIYDNYQRVLIHSGPKMYNVVGTRTQLFPQADSTYLETNNSVRFTSPIYYYDTDFIDKTAPATRMGLRVAIPKPAVIGWIHVEMSKEQTLIKRYQTVLTTATLILVGGFITALLATWLSRNVTKPIMRLSQAVAKIREGDLDTRVDINTTGELLILQAGINNMADALQKAYSEMQDNIEQATEDLRETLETIEVQNVELDLARKEAVAASKIKSEFLANMSHEIRTPLNGIIGFTNLLLKGELSEHQRDHLLTIHKASKELLIIINNILDFSKIEANKLELDYVPFDLRDITEEALAIIAPLAHDKQLDLIPLFYDDVPPKLIGDPLRLKQIVSNLVNNAVKFTHSGQIILRTSLENETDTHVLIKISVTDTGIGLTEEQQRLLFQAFSQGDTSTAREYGGTGLGLMICKRLAEKMGGEIGLESKKDVGSTFWFTFLAEIQSRQQPTLSHLNNRHIGLYETNPMIQLAIRHMLKNWGIQVYVYDDLDKLITALPHLNIDLLFVSLPHYVPQELPVEKVKILAQHKKCPLVLLSNIISDDAKPLLQDAGIDHYLDKPLQHKKLYATLAHFLTPHNDTTISKPSLNTSTVLVVDDNAANLKLLSTLLRDLDIKVVTATNGTDAIELAAQQHFDLIFMDIQMPILDGVETSIRIREQEAAGLHTPIIAVTAHALPGERAKTLGAGIDEYLSKPISEHELRALLNRYTTFTEQKSTSTSATAVLPHDERVVNIAECLQLSAGKPDLAYDMLNMLLNQLAHDRQKINQHFMENDWELLREKIHRLHGATRYCGVPQLRLCTQTVESLLTDGETQQLAPAMTAFNNAVDALLTWQHQHPLDVAYFTLDT